MFRQKLLQKIIKESKNMIISLTKGSQRGNGEGGREGERLTQADSLLFMFVMG